MILSGNFNSIYENRPLGDANGDGRFDSADLRQVFEAGQYEDAKDNNSSFSEGDWNGDGEFDSSDLVLSFQLGNYLGRIALAEISAALQAMVR